jgi:hypothetical protein
VILRGDSLNNITTYDMLDFEGGKFDLPATTQNVTGIYHIIFLPRGSATWNGTEPESELGQTPPFASISIRNKVGMTTKEFYIKYGQFILGVLILLCCFGIFAGNIVVGSEMSALELPDKKIYEKHLKSYIEVGNAWDPEEEEKLQ